MCPILSTMSTWFQSHEFVAIWLEGIALVAIFIWDRIDSQEQHRETLKQIANTQRQVEIMEGQQRQALAQLEAALNQVEVPQIPFLTFFMWQQATVRVPGLRNAGFGPAVNVHYTATPTSSRQNVFTKHVPLPVSGYEGAIAPGAEHRFGEEIGLGTLQGNLWEILVGYESLSGRQYQTKFTLDDKTQLTRVVFKRIQPSLDTPLST